MTFRHLPWWAASKATSLLKTSSFYNRDAMAEVRREAGDMDEDRVDPAVRLTEAVDWLRRAQDAAKDGGISRGYGSAWVPYLRRKGWQPSYPETTGYIIPTLCDCADYLGDPDLRRRALVAADWEIEVQMPCGAVMGGTVDMAPSPAVFNTGQVMLGWIRAWQESGRESYRDALERAAAWLLKNQDADGGWRVGNSRFANAAHTTYNSRVGFALAWTGRLLGRETAVAAGTRNLDRTLRLQNPKGWFAENDLSDPAAPLSHTIGYAMEGLLGGFDLLGDRRYLEGVILAADHLQECVDERGWLPGRIDAGWRGTVPWSCLTGSAQLAAIFFRLNALTGNPRYASTATMLLGFVKRTQNCGSLDSGLRGGIKGSYPFDGGYGRLEVLSWATKFFIDALLLERQHTRTASSHGRRSDRAAEGRKTEG